MRKLFKRGNNYFPLKEETSEPDWENPTTPRHNDQVLDERTVSINGQVVDQCKPGRHSVRSNDTPEGGGL